MHNTSIGFIGLGAMGSPMAIRLLDAGYPLTVQDIRAERLAPLSERGAAIAATPAAVAKLSDVVLACLPTPDVVRHVACGPEGLVGGGGRAKIYIDLSTTGPNVATEVAEALAGVGVIALDAPVTGGVPGAIAGTLTLIGAGPASAFRDVEPILENLGRVHHVGERAGMGQLLKLINNLLSTVALTASAEALALGVKAGLDIEAMLGVINAGSGRNSATEEKFPRSILPRRFSGGLALGLAYKDVRLCLEQADAYGIPMHMGNAAKEAMFLAKTLLGPDVDATSVVRIIERWAGIEFAGKSGDVA